MTHKKSHSQKIASVLLSITLGATLITASPLSASAATGGISLSIDGKTQTFSQPPLMINDRVYVPVRALLEAFGYEVKWDQEDRSVVAHRGKRNIFISLDGRTISNMEPVRFDDFYQDVPLKIVDGRTMLSARFLGEMLGMEIRWDADKKAVLIDSSATAIFDAIMQDDLQKVRTLLDSGTDPNITYKDNSAFLYSIASRTPAITKLLVAHQADIDQEDLKRLVSQGDADLTKYLLTQVKHDKTPAQLASDLLPFAWTNTDMSATLLGLGAVPNQTRGIYDFNALEIAGSTSSTAVLQALLDAGFDPNTKTKTQDDQTVNFLLTMVARGNIDVTEILLDHGADPNSKAKDDWTPLMLAAKQGNVKMVQMLAGKGADIHAKNKYGATAWAIAKAHGNTETVKALLAIDAKQDQSLELPDQAFFMEFDSKYGKHPLEKAAIQGQTDEVTKLLAKGNFDPDTIKKAFDNAVISGNVETLQALLTKSESVKNYRYYLNYAMNFGNLEILRLLISHENWNPTSNPKVADFIAEWLTTEGNDHVHAYQMLLEAGFDPNAVYQGRTPLTASADRGLLEVTKLLVQAGTDANWTNSRQETALSIAATNGHTELLKALLTADNLTEKTKGTALIAAVNRDSLDMIAALLAAGADPAYQTKDGLTPLQLADEIGNPAMIELLTKGNQQ